MNMRVREICKDKGVEHINVDIQRSMTGKDGVHLNLKGRQFVGQRLMKHCL